MSADWDLTELEVIEDYAIRVKFADGIQGIVRFLPESFKGVFSHLLNPEKFREVSIVDGAVTWPGELDMAPDRMHDEIKEHGEWIVTRQ